MVVEKELREGTAFERVLTLAMEAIGDRHSHAKHGGVLFIFFPVSNGESR